MAEGTGSGVLMKTVIIANPASGRINYPSQVEAVRASLEEDAEVRVAVTSRPLEAVTLAREAVGEGAGLIVAIGGDGTINEVINGMAGRPAVLGVIPAGLSNVLARELGIPSNLIGALAIIKAGHLRRIDLGSANGRFFSLMVGVGIDAEAVRTVNPTLKKFLKRYSYHLAGFKSLLHFRTTAFPITIDGKEEESGYAAVISNARYYGGPHQINPEARIDDGLLHLCLFRKGGRGDYLRFFRDVIAKRLQENPDIRFRKAQKIEISRGGLPVHLDGDFIGYTPLRVEIEPGSLKVLAPSPISLNNSPERTSKVEKMDDGG